MGEGHGVGGGVRWGGVGWGLTNTNSIGISPHYSVEKSTHLKGHLIHTCFFLEVSYLLKILTVQIVIYKNTIKMYHFPQIILESK